MDNPFWHRMQFAFTITYHYLFPQLTMGLALLIAIMKTLGLRPGGERWNDAARFWIRIFGINFAMGVVTGIPMEFQFGTNWARFSRYAGNVIGHTLAMEGLFAFFLESSFLTVLVWGERRVGRVGHWLASLALFVGSWLSGYFIVTTNAFMQHPVGHAMGADGNLVLADYWAFLLNPWAVAQYAHTMVAAVVTGSFVVAAVGAFYALRRVHLEHARAFLAVGTFAGILSSVAVAFPTGDHQAKLVARHQPVALAAMEGRFESGPGAPMTLIGQPNVAARRLDNPIQVPRVLSFLAFGTFHSHVAGLGAFSSDVWPDNIELLYYAFHIMAGLGTLMIAVTPDVFELWFGIVALMFAIYVVLDGYDLGAGALHLIVARQDSERRQVLAAIGPFWDASEVWLLAAGGALFVAFPRVLAAGLSGFYLAIFLVVWSLIGRGIAIEFRSHVAEPLWRGFWDGLFALASALLAILFGAALGNLIRGVPLDAHGWFSLTLFTSFQPRPPVGLLDWYTVATGLFALLALAGHGASFLAWKTDGEVHRRARRLARLLYGTVAVLWPFVTWLTHRVNPGILGALPGRPLAWLGVAMALVGLVAVFVAPGRGRPLAAFVGSCGFVSGLLIATAACVYPVLLRALGAPALSITAPGGGSNATGLRTALGWWVVGFPLAVGYFIALFRIHRGKAEAAGEGEGY